MVAPSEKLLKSLVNLQGNPDFQELMDWVSDSCTAELDESVEVLDETRLRWGQGKAQCLKEIMKTVDTARNLLRLRQK